MVGAGASGRGPQMTPEEAAELDKARERMIARHKLIEAMIRNNELQLKNESARGGAEIERACALRDAERRAPTKPRAPRSTRVDPAAARCSKTSTSVWSSSGNG